MRQKTEVERLDAAGGLAEQHGDTKRRQAVERLQESVLADGVVDRRHFLALRDFVDALREILARIDNCVGAAMGLGELCLLIVADGADDGGAEMLRPLAQDKADAAGRGVQQDGIAGFDAIGLADQILHRQALQHHRRCGLVVDVVGQFDQTVSRNHPLFGIGAERRASIGDAVARPKIGDARPDFLHHASRLAAQAARQLHGIEPRPVVDIDKIQAHGSMADARLPRPGLANLDFLPGHNFGTAGFMKADGVRHGISPQSGDDDRQGSRWRRPGR